MAQYFKIPIIILCTVLLIVLNNAYGLDLEKILLSNSKRLRDSTVDVPWISDYDQNRYQFRSGYYSWISAREFCLSQNSDLVVIDSEKKLNWILDHYKPLFSNYRKRFVYIGLLLEPVNALLKEWRWINGTILNNKLFKWMPETTFNKKNNTEQCAVLNVNEKLIDSINCDSIAEPTKIYRFICERSYKNILEEYEEKYSLFVNRFKKLISSLEIPPIPNLSENQQIEILSFASSQKNNEFLNPLKTINNNSLNNNSTKNFAKDDSHTTHYVNNSFELQEINSTKSIAKNSTTTFNDEEAILDLFEKLPFLMNDRLQNTFYHSENEAKRDLKKKKVFFQDLNNTINNKTQSKFNFTNKSLFNNSQKIKLEPNSPVFVAHFSKMYIPIENQKHFKLEKKIKKDHPEFQNLAHIAYDNYTLGQLALELEEMLLFSNKEDNITEPLMNISDESLLKLQEEIHHLKNVLNTIEKLLENLNKSSDSFNETKKYVSDSDLENMLKITNITNNNTDQKQIVLSLLDYVKYNLMKLISNTENDDPKNFGLKIAGKNNTFENIDNITAAFNIENDFVEAEIDNKTRLIKQNNTTWIMKECADDNTSIKQKKNSTNITQIIPNVEKIFKNKNLKNQSAIEKLEMQKLEKSVASNTKLNSKAVKSFFDHEKFKEQEVQKKIDEDLNNELLKKLQNVKHEEREEMIKKNNFQLSKNENETNVILQNTTNLLKKKELSDKFKKDIQKKKKKIFSNNENSTAKYELLRNLISQSKNNNTIKIEEKIDNNNVKKIPSSFNDNFTNLNKSALNFYAYNNSVNNDNVKNVHINDSSILTFENYVKNQVNNTNSNIKEASKKSLIENPTQDLINAVLAIKNKMITNNLNNSTNQKLGNITEELKDFLNESNNSTFPLPSLNLFKNSKFQNEIKEAQIRNAKEKDEVDKAYKNFLEKIGPISDFEKKIQDSDAKRLIVKQSNLE